MIEKVLKEVEDLRAKYGHSICTDVKVYEETASYVFQPGTPYGYKQEYDLQTGKERHCGLGPGCFWSDWQ